MRPNVLLVVFDTARADAFAPYGAPPGSTPATTQLALGANGMAHPAMFSTACWTLPAHASMFTGRLPRSTGFATGTPPVFKAAMSAMGSNTLPAALRGAGYDTAGLSANPWVSAASGFDQGFERFRFLETDRNTDLASTRPLDRAGWLLDALRARADDGAQAIEQQLGEWLQQRDRRPFFWFVNLMECHSPYLPPKPYSPYGPIGRIRAARDASRHCTLDALWRLACGGWDIEADALIRMRAMYDASIRQLDDWLARVLQRLDAARVLDETIVIVTSDHGENLGESHRFGHTASLDNRLLHVPLVTSGPVALDFEPVASLADMPGVLTRALEVDAAFLDDPTRVPGVAVAQMDSVGTKGDPRIEEVIRGWGLGAEALEIACTSFSCATDGGVKLVRRLGVEQLFDLTLDPLEEHPLLVDGTTEARYAPHINPLRRALDLAEADEGSVAAPTDDRADPDEVAALEKQMRLLGYL
jgi:arylsulfatase A-like enzyme